MKIISLSKLQNAEHLSLLTNLHSLVAEADIQALQELKNQLKEQITQAEAAQIQIRKSEHTQTLAMLDQKRDDLYRGLTLRVQSESFSPTEAVRTAAQKVSLVTDTYGNFITHNYEKETTEIQNLIDDLKSPTYFPAVQTIGLAPWVTWLENANNEFHRLYTQRRNFYAEQIPYNLKEIRKKLDELFKKTIQTIDALAILQPSQPLTTLINKLNVSIEKWNEIIAQRNGRKTEKTKENDL